MSNIIPFVYKGQLVRFDADGWLHATEIAAHFEKEPSGWVSSIETLSYIVALAKGLGMDVDSGKIQEFNEIKKLDSSKASTKARINKLTKAIGLVRARAGAPDTGGGTWLHPKLAVVFARWLNIDFAVWCDLHIDALLRGELDEKSQFDRACRDYAAAQQRASLGAREMALFRWRKPALLGRVELCRHQLQLVLGIEEQVIH